MKKFLVIGNPIDHSLSPKLHNFWIKKYNLDAIYGKLETHKSDLAELCDSVGILPLGITYTEKQILETLNACGSATLTGLAAKLGLSKTALQRDHELYLLNKDLIAIDGKRKITTKGMEVCEAL